MEKLSLDHLPPGVRFSPKDPEVIELYLKKKIIGNDKDTWFIPEIKFYEDEPWDLPIKSGISTEDQEWFFFTEQSLKHQNDNPKKRKRGQKQELVNRQTKAGFWKSTGPDREIESGEGLIGMKKTLVFHIGSNKREEKAIRTNWVMHEYRTTQKDFDGKLPGQKPFVLCRLFNNEEKSNKGGPAKSKPVLSDVTELVQCNNDNDHDKAYVAENQAAKVDLSEEDIELLMGAFYVPPEDSPSSLPLTTPDVSTPITVKTSHKETQSEPTLAPASHELPEQAEYHPINCMTRFDNAAPLACNDDYNACAAEDLVGEVNTTEVDLDLDMDKAFEMFYIPQTAEASLEAQSMLAPASVSPELGSEADNYRTSFRCLPEEKYDGITTKTIVPIEYNGDNTYVAKNKVAEVTSDVVEAGSNMFPDTPQPLGCNMLSPRLHSHMQAELGSSCISYPFTNDLNNGYWRVHHQSDMNVPAPNFSESGDLTLINPDKCFRKMSSSQNNLAFDDGTLKNMVSDKDNGSCSGLDANALLFALEAPELVSLDEIFNPEVSSGLLKSGSYLGSLGGS
nr:nac domain-containing protein 62 [Quercus suber]